MYRRNLYRCFPSAIPRDAWDPAHHNTEWHDSYAEHITKRRDWPTRKWLVGLVPKTPREFLEYSHRNLTYQYNARMRACTSFPEMVPYYKEMLTRGIKVDVDTMYTVLTRASRFGMITAPQIFELCDEMRGVGARMDLTVTEVLHTVLDSVEDTPNLSAWKASKRAFLITVYNNLLGEEIQRLGSRRLFHLLLKVFSKYRANLRSLQAGPSYENYAAFISFTQTLAPRDDHLWYDRKEPSALISVLTILEALKQDVYDSFCATVASMPLHSQQSAEEPLSLAAPTQASTVLEYLLKPRHGAAKQPSSSSASSPSEASDKNEDTLLCLVPIFQSAHAASILTNSSSGAMTSGTHSYWHDLHERFSLVYMAAIQNAVMRYGTHEGRPMLLYFMNALFQNLRKDGVRPSIDVWREVADIGKYYDRTVFLRNVVRESCRGKHFDATGKPQPGNTPADLRVLSRYICTVDPWSTTPVNPFVAISGAKNASTPVNTRTPHRAMRRYQEARDFLHTSVQLGQRTPSSEELPYIQEAVTSLLWFTQKLVHLPPTDAKNSTGEVAVAVTTKDDDELAVVCVQILEDIANIHRGMTDAFKLETIDGEYADHMASLIEALSRKFLDLKNRNSTLSQHDNAVVPTVIYEAITNAVEPSLQQGTEAEQRESLSKGKEGEDALSRLARLHHELTEKLRSDPTTLLAWAEIA